MIETQPAANGVAHIDLSQVATLHDLATGEWLVVLWSNDRPVGQASLSVTGARPVDIDAVVAGAIDPVARADATARSDQALAGARPDVSVVVCTRDRPEQLAHCLASLSLQTLKPSRVIVVDNAPRDDRTRLVVAAAGADYVCEPRPGLDIARNTGARRATSEIVAYTDDDVRHHPRWLERLTAAFDEPHIAAVTGLVLPAELVTDAQRQFEKHWGFGHGFRRIDFGTAFFAADRFCGCPAWEVGAGASMAFRRACFETVGWFDERLDVGAAGCSGDSEYWHRILSRGLTCRYEPSAVAFHTHRRDFEGFKGQVFSYMRGHAAALLVQFERTGNLGNLRRLFLTLPVWFASRIVRRAFGRGNERDRTLNVEIGGSVSGTWYYLITPRARRLASARAVDRRPIRQDPL